MTQKKHKSKSKGSGECYIGGFPIEKQFDVIDFCLKIFQGKSKLVLINLS